MTLLELLDRMGERRAARPRGDSRIMVGTAFLLGYYALVFALMTLVVPGENAPLVRDMLLVLGPGVGLILGALFRSDRRDEEQTRNTGEAFRAVRAAIDRPAGTPADPIHVTEETKL